MEHLVATPTAVVAALILAGSGGLGYVVSELHFGLLHESAPWFRCEGSPWPYTAEEASTHSGLFRIRSQNTGEWDLRLNVCTFDEDAVMRTNETYVVRSGETFVLELHVPVGVVSYVAKARAIDHAGTGGTISNGADLRWCLSHAAEAPEERVYGPNSGTIGGRVHCTANRPELQQGQTAGVSLGGFSPPGSGGWLWTGVGLAVGTSWLTFVQPNSLRALALPLFTRITRPKVLDQKTRADIAELVRVDPGIHASAIQDRLGLGEGQTAYHLRVLVREKVLSRLDSVGLNHYFTYREYSPAQMRMQASLRNPNLQHLLALVRTTPSLTVGEAARKMERSHSSVSKLSRELAKAGLLRRIEQGRVVRLQPTAA